MNGILSAEIHEVWEVAEEVYAATYPDSASDTPLDDVASLTGTRREGETKSQLADVEVTLDAFTGPIAAGGLVANVQDDATARFVSTTIADNPGAAPAVVLVDFEAETAGPTPALANTLNEITEPVTGWTAVNNPSSDADLGSNVETDFELRLRREQEIQAAGGGNVDAIRGDINKVDNVDAVTVTENATSLTDVDGRPPKSFEAVVLGGADDDIAQAIWDSKPGGIESYSASGDSGTAVDSAGDNQVVPFTRPTSIPLHIEVTISTDQDYAGDQAVKDALVEQGIAQDIGDDVIANAYLCAAQGVGGVVDVTVLKIDTNPVPVNQANIVIAPRGLATLADGDIDIIVL
jgi:hypothetical protein